MAFQRIPLEKMRRGQLVSIRKQKACGAAMRKDNDNRMYMG